MLLSLIELCPQKRLNLSLRIWEVKRVRMKIRRIATAHQNLHRRGKSLIIVSMLRNIPFQLNICHLGQILHFHPSAQFHHLCQPTSKILEMMGIDFTGAQDMTADPATLWIITEVEPDHTEVKRGSRSSDDIGPSFGPTLSDQPLIPTRKRIPIDAAALKTQINGLLQVVSEVFDRAQQQTGLQLNEVELTVEINAEGQVSILGNGGKLANKGGITLKFKRS
jgi:hypothetical protein